MPNVPDWHDQSTQGTSMLLMCVWGRPNATRLPLKSSRLRKSPEATSHSAIGSSHPITTPGVLIAPKYLTFVYRSVSCDTTTSRRQQNHPIHGRSECRRPTTVAPPRSRREVSRPRVSCAAGPASKFALAAVDLSRKAPRLCASAAAASVPTSHRCPSPSAAAAANPASSYDETAAFVAAAAFEGNVQLKLVGMARFGVRS